MINKNEIEFLLIKQEPGKDILILNTYNSIYKAGKTIKFQHNEDRQVR